VWKGADVAIKWFIKQKLNERHLLEFRAWPFDLEQALLHFAAPGKGI